MYLIRHTFQERCGQNGESLEQNNKKDEWCRKFHLLRKWEDVFKVNEQVIKVFKYLGTAVERRGIVCAIQCGHRDKELMY